MKSTVLFVDDEANVLRALRRLFRGDPLRLLEASSAEEALEMVRTEEVSVVVSDNRMPGLAGTEFLSRLRRSAPDTVKILLTGYADLEIALTAINRAEVFRLMTKPWKDDELRQAVLDAAERYHVVRAMQDADEAKLLSLAQAIELKDPHTRGHCDRVAQYAVLIADRLGLEHRAKVDLRRGSWLHDCGKIGVPEAVLNKNGPLTPDEFELVKRHSEWGFEVASKARLSPAVVHVIRHHHEKMDGTGYPAGLKGSEIPLEARIVAVADIFDALASDRPYRAAFSPETVGEMVRSLAGAHLDARLVDAFLAAMAADSPSLPGIRAAAVGA
ncbi:MAG: HD domain-containing protein [Deferrisomatales bacterium]|nr:HD domain-containing protein [Deferrisomatales bacterium]